jgi:hypothetical protein
MQIRSTGELFYATYILNANNFSALMINIDPNLLKGNGKYFSLEYSFILFEETKQNQI